MKRLKGHKEKKILDFNLRTLTIDSENSGKNEESKGRNEGEKFI